MFSKSYRKYERGTASANSDRDAETGQLSSIDHSRSDWAPPLRLRRSDNRSIYPGSIGARRLEASWHRQDDSAHSSMDSSFASLFYDDASFWDDDTESGDWTEARVAEAARTDNPSKDDCSTKNPLALRHRIQTALKDTAKSTQPGREVN